MGRGAATLVSLLLLLTLLLLVAGNVLYWDAMEIAVTNTTAQTPLAAPGAIRRDVDLSAVICLSVVDVELQRSSLVRFDQGEKILALMQD